jgi:hypothetical protein
MRIAGGKVTFTKFTKKNPEASALAGMGHPLSINRTPESTSLPAQKAPGALKQPEFFTENSVSGGISLTFMRRMGMF